jgi:lipoprotein-anchoring transpeptidase ErfK/SrfK
MTRAFALLFAAVTVLAGVSQAGAQGYGYRQGYQTGYQGGPQSGYRAGPQDFDTRDIMGGGPNFFQSGSGGSSPIPRETVSFSGQYAPGTIFISTAERRLYLVLANGQALRYGIGVGRDGFRWGGVHRISAKKEWPSWTPPSQMLARRPDLPRHMEGGIDNPLGARAMYLGSTLYRIHGSNEPETIGQAVSSGCFRMTNDDVTDLYSRVSVGTTVVVKN